ncbi:hypothetical protein ACP86_00050 [Marinobacter sp. CP1]|nr:hypothetical protein ACP86_00050 [Marinobacter sp. CP1]
MTNFWLQYDLYIPENYHFRDPEPNASNWYGGGDKVLVVWADENSDPIKPMLQIARLMKRNGSSGETWDPDTAYLEYWFASFDPVTGERRFFDDKGIEGGYQVLIDPVIDRGNWQRRTLHVRMPTSEGSNDGVVEYWVERRTGTDRSITKKLIDVKSGNFFGGNKNYLNRGYLLGWSNAGYNYDVTYLIDNFILANSIDSIDASAIKASSNENRLPNPPSLTIE